MLASRFLFHELESQLRVRTTSRRRGRGRGRTDEDFGGVDCDGTISRIDDVFDKELQHRFEGEIMSIGESDRESISMYQLGQQSESGRRRDILHPSLISDGSTKRQRGGGETDLAQYRIERITISEILQHPIPLHQLLPSSFPDFLFPIERLQSLHRVLPVEGLSSCSGSGEESVVGWECGFG